MTSSPANHCRVDGAPIWPSGRATPCWNNSASIRWIQHPPLIEQRLVQPDPFPPLQHDRRWNPRLGQLAALQQLAQQPRVGAIRLGVMLLALACVSAGSATCTSNPAATTPRPRSASPCIPPPPSPPAARRPGGRRRLAATVAGSRSGGQTRPHHIPRQRVDRVERDLLSVQRQPECHAHQVFTHRLLSRGFRSGVGRAATSPTSMRWSCRSAASGRDTCS